MSKLPQDNRNNFVSFIRHNQPTPPPGCPSLEQKIMDSLEPRNLKRRRYINNWTIPSAMTITRGIPTRLLATGMLFTTVSFGVRTPRIAIEPKDLENFLVNNWQDTLDENNHVASEQNEAYWLLPSVAESSPALSVSAP